MNSVTEHSDAGSLTHAVNTAPSFATPRIIKPKARAVPRGWKSMVSDESPHDSTSTTQKDQQSPMKSWKSPADCPLVVKSSESPNDRLDLSGNDGDYNGLPKVDYQITPSSFNITSPAQQTVKRENHQKQSPPILKSHPSVKPETAFIRTFQNIVTPTSCQPRGTATAGTPRRNVPAYRVSVFKKPASQLTPARPSSPEEEQIQKVSKTVTRVRKPRAPVSRAKSSQKDGGSAAKVKNTDILDSEDLSNSKEVSKSKIHIGLHSIATVAECKSCGSAAKVIRSCSLNAFAKAIHILYNTQLSHAL